MIRLLLIVLLMLLGAAPAWAHAVLVEASPADGQRLDGPPAAVELTFNEPISPVAVRVLDSAGTVVAGPEGVEASETGLRLPLPAALPHGRYLVSYRVTSVDAHPVAGSVAFGIGAEQEREFLAAGVPFRERGRRTDEAIAIMRRCWTEEEVTFQGDFWKLDRITVLPRPVQQPLPLWIGGNSEPAMRRAGRLGDGWIPSFITPDEMRVGIGKVQDLAAAEGRHVPEDHFGTLINYAIADTDAAASALAQPFVPRGRVDEPTMRQCTAFGPVDRLLEKIEDYVKAGASKFILRPLCPPDRMLEQLSRVAEQICPEFHRR